MRIWRRWRTVRGAGFIGYPIGFLPDVHYPFRWMAATRAWIWKTLNFFPGNIVSRVERIKD